jgi:thioredoxin-like negative regulator of GroEL
MSGISVVVVYATWSKNAMDMLNTVVQVGAQLNNNQIKYGRVNKDEETPLVVKLHANIVPSTFVYKNGQQVKKYLGLQPVQLMVEDIKELLNN